MQNMNTSEESGALPLIDALVDDCIGHILSFCNPLGSVRTACKSFHRLNQQNINRTTRERRFVINQHPFDIGSIFNQRTSTQIWIVDATRHSLSQKEKLCNHMHHGPCSLKHAIMHCDPGSKILIFGECACEPDDWDEAGNDPEISAIKIDKNIQFIGVGQNAQLEQCIANRSMMEIGDDHRCNVYFENIEFLGDTMDASGGFGGAICVMPGSKVWVKDCRFSAFDTGLRVEEYGHACVKNCKFSGSFGITMSPIARCVDIIGCSFYKCGQGIWQWIIIGAASAIEIKCGSITSGILLDDDVFVELTCVGNTFELNEGYSIAINADIPQKYIDSCIKQASMTQNAFLASNGRSLTKRCVKDLVCADTIYINDEPCYQ